MQLLAEGTRCLGLWFAPTRAQAEAAASWRPPCRCALVAVGGESGLPTLQPDAALARQLGDPAPGSLCLVRPDAYRAAMLRHAHAGGDRRRPAHGAGASMNEERMITEPHIPDPDGFYAAWIAAHEGLTEAQSADLNARLVLLLANQCGDQAVLLDCIAAAREGRCTAQRTAP